MKRFLVVFAVLGAVAGCATPPSQVNSTPEPPAASTPASPTQAPSPTPTPTPTFEPRTVTINVSGDLLWHDNLWTAAQEDARNAGHQGMYFTPQLAGLTKFVSRADIAVCHEEVPFAPETGPFMNYPQFSAPPQIATAIKEVGWDICTTASNHTVDQGWDGLVRTIDDLRAAGVQNVGSFKTQAEADAPVIMQTKDGVKVAFISQTYGLNGLPKPEGKPWAVSLLDADQVKQQAQAAKQAGADIVAVHMHAGTEYEKTPSDQQVAFAKAVTASPNVDFVFGEHVHVVQPIDKINGKWVIYGTGDLIAQIGASQPWTYDGLMAEVSFTENRDGSFTSDKLNWAPTFITHSRIGNPARVYLIPQALADGKGPAQEMIDSAARTRGVVTQYHPEGLTEMKS